MRDQPQLTRQPLSRRKKIVFTLMTCLLVLACVDTFVLSDF